MQLKFNSIFNLFNRCVLTLLVLVVMGLGLVNCKTNAAGGKSKGLRVLMVGGGSSHDFDKWYKGADAATLRRDGFASVRYTNVTDSIANYLPDADVLYMVNNHAINSPASRQAIFNFVNAGKGLVLGHAGMWYNWRDWPEFNQQIASGGSRGHDRYGSFEVTVDNPNHPVTKGVDGKFSLKDERYYFIPDASGPGIEVLASSSVAGSDKIFPSVFVVKHPKARIVGLALGHDGESHDIPVYQTLLRNSIQWVANK